MDINKYENLQDEFEQNSFEKANSNIERTLYYSSFLGNAASVVFAFFFVNNIVSTIEQFIPGQVYILGVLIVIFLASYELMKRFVFRRLVVNFLVSKTKVTLKTLAGLAFTGLLIFGSFYLSVNGAQRVVDNTEVVVEQVDSSFQTQKNVIESEYAYEIKRLKDKIDWSFKNAEERGNNGLGPKETEDVRRWEQDIKDLKDERDDKVADLKEQLESESNLEINSIAANKSAFIILSSLIELLILIGVGFNAYYWFVSYREFKRHISRSPNYKKYQTYKYLLNILYQNGKKEVGDELPTLKQFKLMVKGHDIEVTQNEIQDFMSICNQLGISRISSNVRKAMVMMPDAEDLIRDYLII